MNIKKPSIKKPNIKMPKKQSNKKQKPRDDDKPSLREKFGFEKKKDGTIPQKGLLAKFPGGTGKYVPLGAWQYRKIFSDSLGPHFTLIVDEAAELLQVEGGRSAEAKEQAAFRDEIETCLKSITQLGRSSGIAAIIATQRNDASVIPGVIQNNCLTIDTEIEVLRPIGIDINKDYDVIRYPDKMQKLADSLGIDYNENGIVFKDEEDKKNFFQGIKNDANWLDEQARKHNISTEIMQQIMDDHETIKIN